MALIRTAKIAMEYPQGHWREPGEQFEVDSQRDAFILEALGRVEVQREAEGDNPASKPANSLKSRKTSRSLVVSV